MNLSYNLASKILNENNLVPAPPSPVVPNQPEAAQLTANEKPIVQQQAQPAPSQWPYTSQAMDYTGKYEGNRLKPYKDSKGNLTVGYGFNLANPQSQEAFTKILPKVPYQDVVSGKRPLSDEESKQLFSNSIQQKYERARQRIPDLDNLPPAMQVRLVDAEYRGDLGISPKTLELINQGQYAQAAEEFPRNHRDFEVAKGSLKERLGNIPSILKWYSQKKPSPGNT